MASWGNPAAMSALLTAYGQEYVAAGQCGMKNGLPHDMTLGNIYWHLTTRRGWQSHIAGYIPCVNTPNLPALHAFVKHHTWIGNPVIAFVSRAYALTLNQPGIYGHFICMGGINSVKGYTTANGDTLDGLKSIPGAEVPVQWNTWAQLVSAGVNGMIALDGSKPQPAPAPAPIPAPVPAPVPSPTPDDVLAAVTAAIKSLYHLGS
jgi:hypothetical protein